MHVLGVYKMFECNSSYYMTQCAPWASRNGRPFTDRYPAAKRCGQRRSGRGENEALVRAQIVGQRFCQWSLDEGTRSEMRMVHFERDLAHCRQIAKPGGIGAEREGYELDRAYLSRRHLSFIEAGADALSVKNDPTMALESEQARKLDVAFGRVGIRDEQGGG